MKHLLCALLVLGAARAHADEAPGFESVVTAAPSAPEPRERRIGRAELEARGEQTATEALERLPFLNASTGARGERIFTLRGFDQRQTAVLFDGAPLQLPYDGQLDLGMLPAEALEELRVARGPTAGLLATSGLGGALSITPRRPGAAPTLALRAEGSAPQAVRLGAAHGHRAGPLAWTLYGGFDQRNGFPLPASFVPTERQPGGLRLNSDRRTLLAGGGVEWAPNAQRTVRVSATHLDGERGVPPALEDPLYRRFTVWRATLASLEHRSETDWHLAQTLYVRSFDNLLDAYDDARYSTQVHGFHSWHHDRVVGLILRGAQPLGAGPHRAELRARADAQWDEHREAAADPMSRALLGAAAEGELALGRGARAVLAAPLQAELPIALPGEQSRASVALDPLLSVRLEAREGTSLGLLVARRHRLPTLKERFSRGNGFLVANPELASESAWHFEVDGAWQASPAFALEASLFDAEVSRLIERVALDGSVGQMRNVGDARLAGLELGAKVRLGRALRGEAGYSLLHARRRDGDPLQYRPAHKATATAIVLPLPWVRLATTLRVVGPQRFLNPGAGTEAWGTLGSYALAEASVDVEPVSALHLYMRATNLLDTLHQTEFGFPEPGRQLWAGLRFAYL